MRNKLLLCSDYDGTFDPHNPGRMNDLIVERNKCAVAAWRRKGNLFAFATGRGPDSFGRTFPEWVGCADYLIACDGAIIISNDGQLIYINPFGEALAKRLADTFCAFCLSQPYAIVGYDGSGEKPAIGADCCKANIWTVSGKECQEVEKTLISHFGDELNITSYYNIPVYDDMDVEWVRKEDYRNLITITKRGANKAAGIEALRAQERILIYNVFTIGDGVNDISMANGCTLASGRQCAQFEGYAVTRSVDVLKEIVGETHIVGEVYILIDKLL